MVYLYCPDIGRHIVLHNATVFRLGTPGSSPAPEATLEHGAPRRKGWHRTCEMDI